MEIKKNSYNVIGGLVAILLFLLFYLATGSNRYVLVAFSFVILLYLAYNYILHNKNLSPRSKSIFLILPMSIIFVLIGTILFIFQLISSYNGKCTHLLDFCIREINDFFIIIPIILILLGINGIWYTIRGKAFISDEFFKRLFELER